MTFEAALWQERFKPKRRRRLMLGISLFIHGAVLVAAGIYSVWHVEEMTTPNMAVMLHAAAAPPPPPPPPAKKRSSTKPKTKPTELVQPKPNAVVQPKEETKEEPPSDEDEGSDKGVEGGVKGGVVGGVVGGLVGSTGVPSKMVSAQVARAQLLINPNEDQYKVRLPPSLNRAGIQFWAGVKVCVSQQGTVSDVRVLKSADPSIDQQIPVVLRRWRYRPYTIDNRPVPFCYMLRYEITAR